VVEEFLQDMIPMKTQAQLWVQQVTLKYLHRMEVVVQKNSQWKKNNILLGYESS